MKKPEAPKNTIVTDGLPIRAEDLPCGCNESVDYFNVLRAIYVSVKNINELDRTTLEKQAFFAIEFMAKKYERKL